MIYIRTDMNEKIATGHVMRCLSVADAAKRLGEEVTFLLADEQAERLVAERGHRSIVLHSHWEDPEAELGQLTALIRKERIQGLLVDSYSVTRRYLEELRKHTCVIYMDDRNAFLYPVDVLLCYAGYHPKYHFEEQYRKDAGDGPQTELLLGTAYAPLREEFCGCRQKVIACEVKKLLLLSGGSDAYQVVDRLLGGLDKERYEAIYAVCGIYYPNYEGLAKKYQDFPTVKVLRDVRNLKEYMEEADLAVSAAGSTLYELAAVGTPTVSYTVADNQIDNAMWWQESGIFAYAGDVRETDVIPRAIEEIRILSEDCEERKKRSVRMQQCVDGKGAERIARRLMEIKREARK